MAHAIRTLLERNITPNIILVREPPDMIIKSDSKRKEIQSQIATKILNNLYLKFDKKNILSIPFYKQSKIDELGKYLKQKMPHIIK